MDAVNEGERLLYVWGEDIIGIAIFMDACLRLIPFLTSVTPVCMSLNKNQNLLSNFGLF